MIAKKSTEDDIGFVSQLGESRTIKPTEVLYSNKYKIVKVHCFLSVAQTKVVRNVFELSN